MAASSIPRNASARPRSGAACRQAPPGHRLPPNTLQPSPPAYTHASLPAYNNPKKPSSSPHPWSFARCAMRLLDWRSFSSPRKEGGLMEVHAGRQAAPCTRCPTTCCTPAPPSAGAAAAAAAIIRKVAGNAMPCTPGACGAVRLLAVGLGSVVGGHPAGLGRAGSASSRASAVSAHSWAARGLRSPAQRASSRARRSTARAA